MKTIFGGLLLRALLLSADLVAYGNICGPSGSSNLPFIGVDFSRCQHQTVMCCWNKKLKKDGSISSPGDNTDVCAINGTLNNSNNGNNGFQGGQEGDVHCHGFTWSQNKETPEQLNSLLKYVNQTDHYCKRGYFGGLQAGVPDCTCIEDGPIVSRSDCTQIDGNGGVGELKFTACKAGGGNDLKAQIVATNRQNAVVTMRLNLVDDCGNFLKTAGAGSETRGTRATSAKGVNTTGGNTGGNRQSRLFEFMKRLSSKRRRDGSTDRRNK